MRFDSVAWITSLIAAAIAIFITTVIPAGYFFISYQYMIGSIDSQVEIAARNAEMVVMANPNAWQFEETRLQELLHQHHDQTIPELGSIVDIDGNSVATTADSISPPIVMRSSEIYDAGTIVGHIEVSRSLRPLLLHTALICLISLMVGSAIFIILRTIPLRALTRERLKTQKLEMQTQQLQKIESLRCMAGGIAHNFNNILAAVIGNLEITIEELAPGSDEVENLTDAMDASRRAADLISMMLTYLGQTPGKMELLDLSATCNLGISMLRTTLPKKVTIKPELPSPGPTIHSNIHHVQQILTTLITNSCESIVDYRGGTIRVAVKTLLAKDIDLSHRFPIDWEPTRSIYACMEIADNGCGIADGDIEKIFDPFFTTRFIGRGLGLPMILGIIRSHEGAISVNSKLGTGSVFRVFLPTSTEKIQVGQERLDGTTRFKGEVTDLILEDWKELHR